MWERPSSIEEWEQMYAAVIEDYEDELSTLEAEKQKVAEDAQTLGQVIAGYQQRQAEWKVIEQRFQRQTEDLSETLEDRTKRLEIAEKLLERDGYQRQAGGRWVRVR